MKTANLSSRIIGAMTKSKPVTKLCNNFNKNFDKALGWTTVGSIVAKDGLGCAMYVYQSKHNKKIPDDRRRFVTATDLTNGGLMVVTQIASFLAMRKISRPIFNKIFNKLSNEQMIKYYVSRFRMKQKGLNETVSRKIEVIKEIEKYKDKGASIFKFVLDLSAAAIFAKRVLVPFIAIPLASRLEKRMEKKAGIVKGNQDNNTPKVISSNPTMTHLPAAQRPNWFNNK